MPDKATTEQHWLAIGMEAHRMGRLHDAEKAYKALLAAVPNSADGLHLSGVLIKDGGGNLNLAAAMIESALDLHPERAVYWSNLGLVRHAMNDAVNAEHAFRRALALQPNYTAAVLGLVDTMVTTGRWTQARACVEQAFALGSGQHEVWVRMGIALANFGDLARAEICYRRAIEMNPGSAEAHAVLSVLLLRQGRFEEGWAEAEHRLGGPRPQVDLPLAALDRWPRWRGEPLAGKRLLLCGEQGYGDVIQFARYARVLQAQGATVDLAGVFPVLENLMRTVPGVSEVYAEWPQREDYDFWVPMWNVPRWCGTTLASIPTDLPYLSAGPERVAHWHKRLKVGAKGAGLNVGVVWAGRPSHANDRYRSMRLADLQPLAELPGIAWHSLQVGESAAQLAPLAPAWPVQDLGAELPDFAETAAVIENLDLVITVDTAVAHLAGALGKPVWVLLPAWGVDWRWMRERSDSPWYPSLTLFRQAEPLQWGPVVAELAMRLAALTNDAQESQS